MPRVRVTYVFQDNNGKRSEVRLHCLFVDTAPVEAFALAGAAAMQRVSSAVIVSVQMVWAYDDLPASQPGPDSDCTTGALLLYRNGDVIGSLTLPSPAGLPVETVGPYAGIRITREALDLSGVLTSVESLVDGALVRLGRPYPTTFIVGGRTKI